MSEKVLGFKEEDGEISYITWKIPFYRLVTVHEKDFVPVLLASESVSKEKIKKAIEEIERQLEKDNLDCPTIYKFADRLRKHLGVE